MPRAGALAALLTVLWCAVAWGQGTGEESESTSLVDVPTAGTLARGGYSLGLRVEPGGGLLADVAIGVTPYLGLGVSYGAGNVVGSGEPDWNTRVEFDVKLRVAEELGAVPAIAVGYDGQGFGEELPGGGYEKPSLGFFAVATKTLPFSEYWQAHVGVARTLELRHVNPDVFVGLSARLSQEFSIITEYQLAADRDEESPSAKNGYLNAGLRWVFMSQLELDMYFRNLVGPRGSPELASRSIAFVFYESF
jgi:hypothetical protein